MFYNNPFFYFGLDKEVCQALTGGQWGGVLPAPKLGAVNFCVSLVLFSKRFPPFDTWYSGGEFIPDASVKNCLFGRCFCC